MSKESYSETHTWRGPLIVECIQHGLRMLGKGLRPRTYEERLERCSTVYLGKETMPDNKNQAMSFSAPLSLRQESVFSIVFSSPSLQHYLCDIIPSLIPLQVHWTPGCSWYLLSSLILRFQFFSQMWPAQWVFSWSLYFKLEPPVFPLFPSIIPITIWHMIILFILIHYLPTCRKKVSPTLGGGGGICFYFTYSLLDPQHLE